MSKEQFKEPSKEPLAERGYNLFRKGGRIIDVGLIAVGIFYTPALLAGIGGIALDKTFGEVGNDFIKSRKNTNLFSSKK